MLKDTKVLVRISLLTAISAVLYYLLEIPLIPGFPYLKFNFADIPALLGAVLYGPVAGILIEFLRAAIHLTKTSSFGIGEFIDFLIGTTMICTFIATYVKLNKRWAKKNISYIIAIIAAVVGTVIIGALANYALFPLYFKLLGNEVAWPVVYSAIWASVPQNILRAIISIVPLWPFINRMKTILQSK